MMTHKVLVLLDVDAEGRVPPQIPDGSPAVHLQWDDDLEQNLDRNHARLEQSFLSLFDYLYYAKQRATPA